MTQYIITAALSLLNIGLSVIHTRAHEQDRAEAFSRTHYARPHIIAFLTPKT